MSKKSFFLHKDGFKNPKAELITFLKYLERPEEAIKKYKKKIQCLYPARTHWLKSNYQKELKLKSINFNSCRELNSFIQDIDAESLSYLYVGPFLSNPASVMGHNLLLLKSPNRSNVINYSVGYSALVSPDINPLEYIWSGLTGGFLGSVKVAPFFTKITEYVKIENRSIWEYQLNLKRHEILLISYHIWELKREDFFNYYFLDENCAYLLVAFIDLVKPELNLLDQLDFFVLPNKIPLLLKKNALLEKESYYPSYKENLLNIYNTLSKSDQKYFVKNRSNKNLDIEEIHSPDLLVAFMNHLNNETIKTEGKLTKENQTLFDSLALKRVQFPPKENINHPKPTSPIQSHGLPYLGLYAGIENNNENRSFLDFTFRPFIHEFSESSVGHVENSEILLMKTNFRLIEKEDFRLQNIDIFSIGQIARNHPFDPLASFKIEIAVRERLYSDCQNCFGSMINLAYGFSRDILKNYLSIYFLGRINQNYKLLATEKYQYSIGPEIGLICNHGPRTNININYSPQFNHKKDFSYHHYEIEGTHHLNFKNSISLNIEGRRLFNNFLSRNKNEESFKFGYHYYF